MKPFDQLTTADKAKLLYELFPEEMPGYLNMVRQMSQFIREQEEENRKNWAKHLLFTFDQWLAIATDIEQRINKYGETIHEISWIFSEQLFEGDKAFYMAHYLRIYSKIRKPFRKKFDEAITLLFT